VTARIVLPVVVFGFVAGSGLASADEREAAILLTLEGQAALKAKLSEIVRFVSVQPAPGPLEDPAFVPKRIGQAAVVMMRGRPLLATSSILVAGASRIEVVRPGQDTPTRATKAGEVESKGLVLLDPEGGSVPRAALDAPYESVAAGRYLFFLLPAGTETVVSHTLSLGPAGVLLDGLILVGGRLPEGTGLFDAQGRIAAIAIRVLPPAGDGFDRTLAATIPEPPPPETPK
jgi:hypothetical protein